MLCDFIKDNKTYILGFLIFIVFLIVINNMENYEGFGRRERTIDMLNKDRGELGQFYVNCYKCGREGILDEYSQYEKVNNNNVKNNNSCNLNDKKMSFYNKKYIDTDMIYCYNCLTKVGQ